MSPGLVLLLRISKAAGDSPPYLFVGNGPDGSSSQLWTLSSPQCDSALCDPFAEVSEILMWARDYLNGDDLADAFRGFGAGFDGGLEGRDIAAEKSGDVAGADGLVAGHRDVGRLQGGVGGLEERTETFGFNHAESFLSHGRNAAQAASWEFKFRV